MLAIFSHDRVPPPPTPACKLNKFTKIILPSGPKKERASKETSRQCNLVQTILLDSGCSLFLFVHVCLPWRRGRGWVSAETSSPSAYYTALSALETIRLLVTWSFSSAPEGDFLGLEWGPRTCFFNNLSPFSEADFTEKPFKWHRNSRSQGRGNNPNCK